MKQKNVDTPLGPATAVINKGALIILSLVPRSVDGTTYSISMTSLHNIARATDDETMAQVAAQACATFAPYLDKLEDYHAQAMATLSDLGWPPETPMTAGRFQLPNLPPRFSDADRAAQTVEMSFFAPPDSHLYFHIDNQMRLKPFMPKMMAQNIADSIESLKRAKTAPLKHKVFGSFQPDTFTGLKRRKLGGKMVGFDLHLAKADVDRFKPAQLDIFVPLRTKLETLVPELIPHLRVLKDDWVDDWLDPLNADMAKAFHRAFPEAATTKTISDKAFQNALWLSRIGLNLSGGSATATWDFHVLPKNRDNTIFVIRTKPDGTVIEVTTES